MFEALFYFTGALSVALLILLLGRHEKLGEAISQVEAFKTQNAELREQLKKEAEHANVLLKHLREYYDERVERNEQEVEKAGAVVHVYEQKLGAIIEEMKEANAGTAEFLAELKRQEEGPWDEASGARLLAFFRKPKGPAAPRNDKT